jgi:tetratricopeptide (TPR) repeat protein
MEYRAFLSYSHKDRIWAEWLHKRLENYNIDRSLRGRSTPFGQVPNTLRPIFRDREDFSGGEGLADATRRALSASECLVVICSPNAVASSYVNEEIRTFKELGRSSRIVPIIVDGVPGDASYECFPSALKFQVSADGVISDVPVEVIAADARRQGDGRDIALQRVVAGLLGLGLDEIRRRAVRAQRRRFALLTAVTVAMSVLAVGASVAAWVARQRTILAEERLQLALETAGAVTTKVVTFKSKFGVPAPVLTELLGEVERLLGRLSQEGPPSSDLALRQAKMLDALSASNRDLGDTGKALDLARQAASKLEFVVSGSGSGATPGTNNDLAWQYLRIGDILRQRNALAEAKANFLRGKSILDELAKAEPANMVWQDSETGALGRLVDIFYLQGDSDAASKMADEDIAIRRRLATASPQNRSYKSNLALALGRRANVAQLNDNTVEAQKLNLEALKILKPLAAEDPTNADLAANLAQTMQSVGQMSERLGQKDDAIAYYNNAFEIEKKISDEDPSNLSKLNSLALTMNSLGFLYQRTGRMTDAVRMFKQQIDSRKRIVGLDSGDANQKSLLMLALAQLADAQSESGDDDLALANIEEAIGLGKQLDAAGELNTINQTVRVIHLGMLATLLDRRGDNAGSLAAVQDMGALSDRLVNQDPKNGMALRGLVISRSMLALKDRQQHRPRDALDALNATLRRIEPEMPRLTQDIGWLQIVSEIYNQIYLTEWDLQDFEAARDAATHCLDYAQKWSETDKLNREARQSVARGYTVLGNALRRLQRRDEAIASHKAAIAIRTDLVTADPNNLSYKADLANSWTRLGDVYSDMENYPAALDAERQSIEISGELVARDPSNVYWQDTIASSNENAGVYLRRLGRRLEARTAFELALATREKLSRADTGNKALADNLAWTRDRVAELSDATPGSSEGEHAPPQSQDPGQER